MQHINFQHLHSRKQKTGKTKTKKLLPVADIMTKILRSLDIIRPTSIVLLDAVTFGRSIIARKSIFLEFDILEGMKLYNSTKILGFFKKTLTSLLLKHYYCSHNRHIFSSPQKSLEYPDRQVIIQSFPALWSRCQRSGTLQLISKSVHILIHLEGGTTLHDCYAWVS